MLEWYLIGLACLPVFFLGWRKSLFYLLLIGFLQDPIRKYIEGQPVVLTMLVVIIMGIVYTLALLKGYGTGHLRITSMYQRMKIPIGLYGSLVTLQIIHTLLTSNSLTVAGIGSMSYIGPLIGILLGYHYPKSFADVVRIIEFYIIIATVFAASVWLEWLKFDWRILGTVGMSSWIATLGPGSWVEMLSGFMRSPEIIAWHAVSALILGSVIFLSKEKGAGIKRQIWTGIVFVICATAIVLSGRRKPIGVAAIFFASFVFLSVWYRLKGRKKLILSLFLAGFLVGASVVLIQISGQDRQNYYIERSISILDDPGERVQYMVWENTKYTWEDVGLFGVGAGLLSQGAQHFQNNENLAGKWAESGAAKIIGELGLAVVVVFSLLVWRLGFVLFSLLKLSRDMKQHTLLIAGLIAFFMAHLFNFLVAAQAYGDPFVIIFVGILLGMLLSSPRLLNENQPPPRSRRALAPQHVRRASFREVRS